PLRPDQRVEQVQRQADANSESNQRFEHRALLTNGHRRARKAPSAPARRRPREIDDIAHGKLLRFSAPPFGANRRKHSIAKLGLAHKESIRNPILMLSLRESLEIQMAPRRQKS